MIYCLGILMFFLSFKVDSNVLDQSHEFNSVVTSDPGEKQKTREQLQGSWLLKENSKSKLVFTSDKVHEYYNGELYKTYSYAISETSLQCGENVPVGSKFVYIKWTNIEDPDDVYCYEINTLSDIRLALIYIGGPNLEPIVYKKVKQ